MNRRSILSLQGFIRLVPGLDCIGIAVFGESGMNFEMIAETDGDLTITNFVELFPEQGFVVERLTPRMDVKRRYSIGEPIPIPYVCDGGVAIVMGDRHPTDVAAHSAATLSGLNVRNDVQSLLFKARNGLFQEQLDQWTDEAFEASFPEVFGDRPTNTRYWLSKFRLSIKQGSRRGVLPNKTASSLRSAGTRWLELFGSKTEVLKFKQVFGEANDGVFSREDYTANLFGFLCNKFSNNEFAFLEKFAKTDPVFIGLFPDGLYYFDLTNARIQAAFDFRRPQDFFKELKTRLYRARDDLKFTRCKDLALVLFGTKDIPFELLETIGPIRTSLGRQYRECKAEINKALRSDIPIEQEIEISHNTASRLVRLYDALTNIEAVEYGSARLAPRPDDFLAADREFIKELRTSGFG